MGATLTAPHTRHSSDVGKAWLTLLLFPVVFAGAFLVGEGLISLLGYDVGGPDTPPLWLAFLAATPALLLFWVPAFVAVHFARRAAHDGDRRGWVPAWIAIVVCAAFTLMNVLAPVLGG